MKVRIDYPILSQMYDAEVSEEVEARLAGYEWPTPAAELRAHALNMPLVPGDVVAIDEERRVVDLLFCEPTFMVEVDFKIPINLTMGEALPEDDKARVTVSSVVEQWAREAYVTQTTTYSFMVSAPEQSWINERVRASPYVQDVELVRYPGMPIDFKVARSNADLGELYDAGPWA